MEKEIFKSDRYFILFDIVVSHGQLLLRSQKVDNLTENIDIIFFDTTYTQITSKLNGIRIKKLINGTGIIKYNNVNKYLGYDNNYLFEIESNKDKYYIAASHVKIFENQLEFSESSLNLVKKGKEISSSLF